MEAGRLLFDQRIASAVCTWFRLKADRLEAAAFCNGWWLIVNEILSSALGRRIVTTLAIIGLCAASAAVPGEVDRHCWKSFVPDPKTGRAGDVCEILAVVRGSVTYTEPEIRSLVIGKYSSAAQRLVPRTEAPIRDLRSTGGWRIVVSSFLNREEEAGAMLRIRFFGPDGKQRDTADVSMTLEGVKVGRLFGGADDILAVQSNEEHAYNSMTDIWLLPRQGEPQQLIEMNATLGRFSGGGNGSRPGVWVSRQTYDGVHAETKGWVAEFWAWDPSEKSLAPEKQ